MKIQPLYTKDYYRMEKLVCDKHFKERVQWLRDGYAKLGHPIPDKGFQDYKQFAAWLRAFGKFYHEQNKIDLEKAVLPLRHDKSLSDLERGIRILIEERRLLPLLPNPFIEELMEEFGIKKDNQKLFSFIHSHIFLGEAHLSETPVRAIFKRDDKGEWELAIMVLPHTKLKDIKLLWSKVEEYQKLLPDYQGKNKRIETFERDLRIYNTYKRIAAQRPGKRSRNNESIADLTMEEIEAEGKAGFAGLTDSLVRKAVARIEALNNRTT